MQNLFMTPAFHVWQLANVPKYLSLYVKIWRGFNETIVLHIVYILGTQVDSLFCKPDLL